jgi:hypothetical protein
MKFDLRSRAVAEFLGTAFLLAAVVGSGIMGERLAGGSVAIALLANTLSTGAILVVLVLVLAPISGAHFNPAVTLAMTVTGGFALARSSSLPGVPDCRILRRRGIGPLHVRTAVVFRLYSSPARCSSTVERGSRHLRAHLCNLGLLAFPSISCGIRGRSLHHFGILVHGVHIVRESRGNTGSFGQRYIRWHPSC